MISTQIVNVVVVGGMFAVLVRGDVEPWHAYLATFLTGSAWAVDFSARRAYFAEIFRGDALTNSISLDVVALTGSSIVGPAVCRDDHRTGRLLRLVCSDAGLIRGGGLGVVHHSKD